MAHTSSIDDLKKDLARAHGARKISKLTESQCPEV